MKRAVQNAMRLGAKGIKVQVGGRLAALKSHVQSGTREGRVPLTHFTQTLITQLLRLTLNTV